RKPPGEYQPPEEDVMQRSVGHERNIIGGRVTDAGGRHGPIRRAEVRLLVPPAGGEPARGAAEPEGYQKPPPIEQDKVLTDDEGRFRFTKRIDPNTTYQVEACAFGLTSTSGDVKVTPGCEEVVALTLPLNLQITTHTCPDEGTKAEPCDRGRV